MDTFLNVRVRRCPGQTLLWLMTGPQVGSWEFISWQSAKGFITEEFPNRKKLLIIVGCSTLRSRWDIGLVGTFRSTYFFTTTIDIVPNYIRARY